MKPLILWARDKHPEPYVLRLGPRDDHSVHGQVKINNAWYDFVYDRVAMSITIEMELETRSIRVNEWGWEQ